MRTETAISNTPGNVKLPGVLPIGIEQFSTILDSAAYSRGSWPFFPIPLPRPRHCRLFRFRSLRVAKNKLVRPETFIQLSNWQQGGVDLKLLRGVIGETAYLASRTPGACMPLEQRCGPKSPTNAGASSIQLATVSI